MTTQTPYKTPECRIGVHDLCAGPCTVRLPGVQLPVETLRCDCSCHKSPSRAPHLPAVVATPTLEDDTMAFEIRKIRTG